MKERILLLLLSVLPLFCVLKAQKEDNVWSKLINIEKHPSFPGGEAAMKRFIDSLMVYPKSALDANLEGRVILKFVVGKIGEISDISVVRGLSPECDSIAISIVKAMPKWVTPPSYERIFYSLPIEFKSPYSCKLVSGERIYLVCEQMPSFPGGIAAMFEYIAKNLKYPFYDFCVQGKVVLRFVVTEEGKITNLEVFRSLHRDLDKEAMCVVESMPDWIPGKLNGENVKCEYIIPISFRMK